MIDESHYRKEGKLDKLKRGMYSRLKQPQSRPRRSMHQVGQRVSDDWEHHHEKNVEYKYAEFSKTRAGWGFLSVFAGAFAVLSVVGAIAYIVLGAQPVAIGRVGIAIQGPNTITGGSILELHITVTNTNPAPLETADLIVRYPEGTRVPTNLLTDMKVQRLQLGTIEPGGVRTGTVRAAIFGSAGEHKDIAVELEYRGRGSDALLVSKSGYSVAVISDALDISVKSNKEVVAGQKTDMSVTIKSNAGITLKNVVLHARYPFGFKPDTFDPKPAKDDNYWELGTFTPGEEKVVRIAGLFHGYPGDKKTVHFSAGLRNAVKKEVLTESGSYTSRITQEDITLATLDHTFLAKKPFLGTVFKINDAPLAEYVAEPGNAIPLELFWKNNTQGPLSNIVIATNIYGTGVNPYTIFASKGFYRSIDSVAIWDKVTTKGALANVGSGDTGRFLLRVTPRKENQLVGITNPVITFEVHAAGQRLSETGVPQTLESTVIETIKLATVPKLKARLMYYSNPFKSTGPLPPKVESKTQYGMMWELSNTTNKMKDVKVTASVPPYVLWDDTVSPVTENIVHSDIENTITWYVGELDAGVGIGDKQTRRIAFSLSFVPSASQLGKTPAILKDVKLTGIDTFTGKEITVEIDDVTTQIEGEEDFTDKDATVVAK